MPDLRECDPTIEGQADAASVARVLHGDRQAFAELVTRHQRVLYRHAVSMVLDHDVAADMVQDAFVRAYVSLGECRDATRFRPWVFQILRHRCLDHLKQARRRDVRLDQVAPPPDPGPGPGETLQRGRLRADLDRALRKLPDKLREAFAMHYVEGVPYDAMAGLLNASVSALKMRVARAREQLRSTLRETEAPGVTEHPAARLSIRGGGPARDA